jgi:endogenous inhibitor of DNA gyrase (YacG/DUF329 family)
MCRRELSLIETLEYLMLDRPKGLTLECPRCQNPNTIRTGAYTIENSPSDVTHGVAAANKHLIIYDRKCPACGRHFTEAVEQSTM